MPEHLPHKIFFIGFNKTGTVSYHNMMKEVFGKRAAHRAIWTEWAFCSNKKKLDKYDVFTDGECANIQNLDKLYPNAKYILNTRSLEGWLVSRHKSIERSRLLNKWFFRKIFPMKWLKNYINNRLLDNSERAMRRWVKVRNAYHKYAHDFFENRDGDFLVLDIADKDAPAKLQSFLGVEVSLNNEHKNSSGKDLRSGLMFEALRLKYDEKLSIKKVSKFLEEEELTNFRNEKLYGDFGDKYRQTARSNFYFPTGLVRFLVGGRARSTSFIGKFFFDQLIRWFRGSLEDMNRFVPVRRYGSGAK